MYLPTTSHSTFASNVKAGSFISLDYEGDGSWDHVGFVTAIQISSTSSLGAYDYKVAQHSRNYHAWASSGTNGWDAAENGNAIYGIIIR